MSQRVVVIGAGLIGLTCAVRLAEAGYDTQIFARDLPLESYSAADSGLWLPRPAEPAKDVLRWASATLTELTCLTDDPDSGVRLSRGTLLHKAPAALRPWWATELAARTELTEISRPRAGFGSGWELTVPVADMSDYLPYLAGRLDRAGGSITRMSVPTLPQRGIVVNATGAAARWLAADPDVVPVRGQIVLMSTSAEAPLSRWWLVEEPEAAPRYVVPSAGRVVVGGTAEVEEWDATLTQYASEAILARCLALEPTLADGIVLGSRVGLRPSRSQIRVEKVSGGRGTAHRTLVHCYGHGDNGLTLSWGCADEVLRLIQGLQPSLF